jgi:RimJ/RimL family protein N-acetyltransferase
LRKRVYVIADILIKKIVEVNNNMESMETKRLIIRRLAETDLNDFLAYQNHPDILKYSPDEPISEEHALRFLAQQATIELTDQRCEISLAIHHKEDDKMIGTVTIYFTAKVLNQGEVGWVINPDYQRQGYATEAARVLLDFGFIKREVHRIQAKCDIRNTASIRLMERLGMRREGHFKQSRLIKDVWQDEYIYALLRDEWLLQ